MDTKSVATVASVGSDLTPSSTTTKVTLVCNECGKKRSVSADGQYNDRCPNCGGVDWDVVEPKTHAGTTITDLYLVVDRARERDLDRRAARQALDELGDNASFNSLHGRALEIREELRKTEAL